MERLPRDLILYISEFCSFHVKYEFSKMSKFVLAIIAKQYNRTIAKNVMHNRVYHIIPDHDTAYFAGLYSKHYLMKCLYRFSERLSGSIIKGICRTNNMDSVDLLIKLGVSELDIITEAAKACNIDIFNYIAEKNENIISQIDYRNVFSNYYVDNFRCIYMRIITQSNFCSDDNDSIFITAYMNRFTRTLSELIDVDYGRSSDLYHSMIIGGFEVDKLSIIKLKQYIVVAIQNSRTEIARNMLDKLIAAQFIDQSLLDKCFKMACESCKDINIFSIFPRNYEINRLEGLKYAIKNGNGTIIEYFSDLVKEINWAETLRSLLKRRTYGAFDIILKYIDIGSIPTNTLANITKILIDRGDWKTVSWIYRNCKNVRYFTIGYISGSNLTRISLVSNWRDSLIMLLLDIVPEMEDDMLEYLLLSSISHKHIDIVAITAPYIKTIIEPKETSMVIDALLKN